MHLRKVTGNSRFFTLFLLNLYFRYGLQGDKISQNVQNETCHEWTIYT
jgi:hypothetical protein